MNTLASSFLGRPSENDKDYVKGLLENISDAFLAINSQWEFTYLNQQAEILMRRTRAELLGKNVWQAFPDAVDSIFYQNYHQALAQQHTVHFEAYYPPLKSWFEVRAYPTQEGLLIYFHDITAQIKAHGAIQRVVLNLAPAIGEELYAPAEQHAFDNTKFSRAELELQAIVARNMAEGVCLVQVETSLIVYANPKFEQMFGYEAGELDGQPVTVLNYEDTVNQNPAVALALMDEIKANGVATYEIQNVKKDGTAFWCQATTSVFEHPHHGPLFVCVQQDINARKQAEEQLRESEERYRSVVEALAEGITVQLASSEIIACNESALRILGLSEDQLMGRTSLDPRWRAIHEDGSPFPGEEHPSIRSLTTGQPCRDVVMGVYKGDGSLTWISINAQPIFKENATTPHAVVTSFFDITRSKNLEETLRQSQETYRALAHNLPNCAVLLFDRNLRYLVADGASLNKNGFTREQVEGRTIEEVLPASEVTKLLPYYQAALSGLESTFEDSYNDQAFLIHAVPVRNEAGEVFAGMLLSQDVTLLKQAEQMVANEKERLSVTLRSIADAVVTTDLVGRITLLNRVAEDLTGWSQAEALGRSVGEVVRLSSEKTGQPQPDPIQQTLRAGQIVNLGNETLLQAHDGTSRPIASSCAPIHDTNNKMIGAVLVFRDVTNQRRQAEEMLKTSKLEALGLLAGGIAHDFNNLLTAVSGNLALARINLQQAKDTPAVSQLPTDLSLNENLELVEEAEKAALRARELTVQLLTFAKGGAPVKKVAELSELICESASFGVRGTNVSCQFELSKELWPVEADSGQISQVIQNLVINAVQAMPQGGRLEISAENFRLNTGRKPHPQLDKLAAGRYIKLTIRDHGTGISSEVLPKIFDPYFTTKSGGNGLGLAVCYSIIKKHEGLITVESQPGQGTTFAIYLPASHKETSAPPPVDKASLERGQGRILVMDDEETIRRMLTIVLNRLGYSVVTAHEGEEALALYARALAENQPFEAVILDLTVVGGMGGKQTIARLLELNPQVKAIASSGYNSDRVMANYKEFGFAAILNKPYQLEELSAVIRQLIPITSATAPVDN